MKNKLFNSPFEMSLRVMLLLSSAPNDKFSVERIVGLDFISCYAADFSLPYTNLHGNNNCKYGEMVGRRLLVKEAIKDLVVRGLIDVTIDCGYLYAISDLGKKTAESMKSVYASEYKNIAESAIKKYKNCSDEIILSTIQNLSVKALRR